MKIWLQAARLRTLPAALAPVFVGTAAAYAAVEEIRWGTFLAALFGSIFIQIGTNLANDYSDARRGADTVDRLGPVRVTAAGLVTPRRVLIATWSAFAIAVGFGLYLAFAVGPELIAVGVASIGAGLLYTGGPRPYGYEGLGELFVFIFFGIVAVNGAYYVQLEAFDAVPLLLAVAVGLLSAAILVVNNIRDIETDARVNKRTLAVRIGRERTRRLFAALLVAAFACLAVLPLLTDAPAAALLGLLAAPLGVAPLRAVRERTDGPALNGALAATGAFLAAWSLLVSLGLLLG